MNSKFYYQLNKSIISLNIFFFQITYTFLLGQFLYFNQITLMKPKLKLDLTIPNKFWLHQTKIYQGLHDAVFDSLILRRKNSSPVAFPCFNIVTRLKAAMFPLFVFYNIVYMALSLPEILLIYRLQETNQNSRSSA